MTSSSTGSPATVRTTRTVRASALYDLVVTAGFALPITAPLVLDALGVLHARWGLAGTVPSADDAYTLLFANLTGSLVVVWSVYRFGAAVIGGRGRRRRRARAVLPRDDRGPRRGRLTPAAGAARPRDRLGGVPGTGDGWRVVESPTNRRGP